MDTVIDTNILVHSNDLKGDYGFDCLLFLTNFMQREDNMAVDYNGEILTEYEDNLSGETFPRMFLTEMRKQKRLVYRDSKISNRIDNKLIELGFHEPEDHVFVGVALNAEKVIVTDDSDYGAHGETEKKTVHEYMIHELGLDILNSEQAKARFYLSSD